MAEEEWLEEALSIETEDKVAKDNIVGWVYPEFVDQSCTSTNRDRLFLAALGLVGEAGEVAEIWKKHLLHGDPLDEEALRLEMGDVLWYFTLMCIDAGFTFEEIMEANMKKLKARSLTIPK